MRQAMLYDFHGTLADVSGIRSFLRDRDYSGFYEASLDCPAIESTIQAARTSHEDGFVNLLFTGMEEQYIHGLNRWLAENNVPIDFIAMRRTGDRRKDFLVKMEMLLQAVNDGYYVLRAWEDSPRVVDLLRAQGIEVVVVPGWDDDLVVGQVDKSSNNPIG